MGGVLNVCEAPVRAQPEINELEPVSDALKEAREKEEQERLQRQQEQAAAEERKRREAEQMREQTEKEAEAERVARLEEERRKVEQQREEKRRHLEEMLEDTKKKHRESMTIEQGKRNRYGHDASLKPFRPGVDIPCVALINPTAGARAGTDILEVASHEPYYRENFFNIIDVVKSQGPGGFLDLFRRRLNAIKEEAKQMKTRPRIISGGGDGTGSFALFMVFLALRAKEDRGDGEDLADRGSGFIWSDEDLRDFFPALAQLPLGSANDFAHVLGWGHKYPGNKPACSCCSGSGYALKQLLKWVEAVVAPTSEVVNFDVWGLMPAKGSESCNFKVAELTGKSGWNPKQKVDGKGQLVMKEAGLPAPFLVMLYFTTGFMAYVVARFQLNRHATPVKNKLEYVKQGAGILFERVPPSLRYNLDGVEVDCNDGAYFPPRRERGNKAKRYLDVGFYNINWQGGYAHGKERAGCCARVGCGGSGRKGVCFNDEEVDMLRMRWNTIAKNPGTTYQTDRKKEFHMKFHGSKGQGIFFQWDGEARFAFSPSGEDFDIYIRRVMNIPVVIGPYVSDKITGKRDNSRPVTFQFVGETPAEVQQAKDRVCKFVGGEVARELVAKSDEIRGATIVVAGS